jgi:hypothetical protein
MKTDDIPNSVTVVSGPYAETYKCAKDPYASSWSWFAQKQQAFPHITVLASDEWYGAWRRLHVTVPISSDHSFCVHFFYSIHYPEMKLTWEATDFRNCPNDEKTKATDFVQAHHGNCEAFAQAFVDAAKK